MNWSRHLLNIVVALGMGTAALSAQDVQDEALFVRRIIEFWKDRESQIVIGQINQFLQHYPNSSYKDSLLIILGDAYTNRQEYAKALDAYAAIQAPHLRDKTYNNRLDCLYRLDRYGDLIIEVMPKLPDDDPQLVLNCDQALWLYYYGEALMHQPPSDERLSLARHTFERLLHTNQKKSAHLALAEIELSAQHPEQALEHYITIWNDPEGTQASDVVLPLLQLLFEQNKHSHLIEQQEAFRQALAADKHSILDYYVGRSYFALEQYGKAASYLLPLVNDPVEEREKNILLTLFSSYYHLADRQGMEAIGKRFQTKFPADPFNTKVLYLLAEVCKNNNDFNQALALTESLLTKYPEHENRQQWQFDRAFYLYQMGRWSDSREGFLALVEQNLESPIALAALPYIPNASQLLLEEAERRGEDVLVLREQLLQDLQAILRVPEAIKVSQMPKYYLRLGKVLCDLQRYSAAKELLHVYIKEYPEDPLLDQGYLLLAFSNQGLQDIPQFIEAAEKVLQINPEHAEQLSLRLNLFSAFLKLSKTAQNPDQYIDQAAEYLYQVLLADSEKVKPENKVWLANVWYEKLKASSNDYGVEPLANPSKRELAKKAKHVLEHALDFADGTIAVNLEREVNLYKLSNIYGWLDCCDKQIALLELLKQAHSGHPEQPWVLRTRTLYALAYAYRNLGADVDAQDYFQELNNLKITDPYLAKATKLEWARMTLKMLPPEKHTLDDATMMAVLKTFKDIQMRRVLSQEPLHFEAALDYAAARSALEPPEKQEAQMLFLMRRAKEEFSSKDDMWGKEYAISRQQNPDKEMIYQAYMMLIEAHLLRLESKLATKPEDAKQKIEAARALYKNLVTGKFAVSKYLVDQAQSGLMISMQGDYASEQP